jgi:hypothetical protein
MTKNKSPPFFSKFHKIIKSKGEHQMTETLHACIFERTDGKFIAVVYNNAGKALDFEAFDTAENASSAFQLAMKVTQNIWHTTSELDILTLINEMAKNPQEELKEIINDWNS